MDQTDIDPDDVFEHAKAIRPSSDGTGDGIGIAGDPDATGPAVTSLEEESNPWKETKCVRLATTERTTDSSVE